MPAVRLDSTYGVIVHRDFIPLKVDDNYAKIFGYDSAKDLLQSTNSLLDLIAPKEWEHAKANYRALLSGEMKAATKTHININSKGEQFTVLTLDQVILWEGEPALQVTVVDLTSIEKANQRIRDNERQYRNLIIKSAQGMMIQRDFKPILVNDTWLRLYRAGSEEEVMSGPDLLSRIPEKYQSVAKERYNQLISGEIEGGSIVIKNVCFDGNERIFHIYENRIEWDGEPALQTVVQDVTEKVQLEKELAYKASHDQLTDLFNRDAVFDWLSKSTDTLESLACLVIDIDNFKNINDTYGHYAGDKVIKAFANICESVTGEEGIVGRWGGEEYLVLMPNVSKSVAVENAEKIRQACEKRICRCDDQSITTTVSIGVSQREYVVKGNMFQDLLCEADARMYEAKASGKNKVSS